MDSSCCQSINTTTSFVTARSRACSRSSIDSAFRSSSVSVRSTIEFHHEAFELIEPKIQELCNTIWPRVKITFPTNLSIRHRIARAFRGVRDPSRVPSKPFVISRQPGGSFNRVIGIKLNDQFTGHASEYILRIPRFDTARPDRDAAILQYVRLTHPAIPAADIVATDFTNDNVISEPYMIQTKLPGKGLHSKALRYPQLTQQQQCAFASQFGSILRRLKSTNVPQPGHIEATRTLSTPTFRSTEPCLRIRPFDVDGDLTHENPDPDEMTITGHQPAYPTPLAFFQSQFARWKAAALKRNNSIEADYMDAFSALAAQLHEAGFLGHDDGYVLCHRDLNMSPHNILVDVDGNGELSITGILDWDSAILAPAFAACVPPMWIWAWNDAAPEDEREANDIPATPEQQERKRVFESMVGESWLRYAYGAEYRIARKLCEFAVDGLHSSWKMEEADSMFGEWAAMRPEGAERIWGPLEGDEASSEDLDEECEDEDDGGLEGLK